MLPVDAGLQGAVSRSILAHNTVAALATSLRQTQFHILVPHSSAYAPTTKFIAKTAQTSLFSTISSKTAACGDFPQLLALYTTIRRLRLLPSLSLKYFQRPRSFQSRLAILLLRASAIPCKFLDR
jgi:hypothetical protein